MKIVIFAGPHGAGKDTIISKYIDRLKQSGVTAKKALYYTTRELRPSEIEGVDILGCTPLEFERKLQNGELAYHAQIGDKKQFRVGTPWSELNKTELVITNIATDGVEVLKNEAKKKNGEVFSIFLTAPYEIRKQRIMRREGIVSETVDDRLKNDPSPEGSEINKNFDLILENPEGTENETTEQIFKSTMNFIKK